MAEISFRSDGSDRQSGLSGSNVDGMVLERIIEKAKPLRAQALDADLEDVERPELQLPVVDTNFNATDFLSFLQADPKATARDDMRSLLAGEAIKKSRQKENPNEFLQKVADKYNSWIYSVIQTGRNPQSAIYRDFTFSGNWQDVEATDYFVHRLSLIGTDGKTTLTPEDVRSILDRYRFDASNQEITDYAYSCYADFNQSARRFGLPEAIFDQNRILFLPQSRIQEIRGTGPEDDCLAFTLYSEINEMLIPVDSEEYQQDPNALYDVIVHELGHQSRRQAKISGDVDESTFLEEGIIQSHAKAVAHENGRTSNRSGGVYEIEVWVVENLAKKMNLESLVGLRQQEIKDKMREIYKHIGATDPFEILEDDVYEYKQLLKKSFEADGSSQEFQKIRKQLLDKKEEMKALWGFN